MTDPYRLALVIIIAVIVILILVLFLAAVTRRIRNARKYASLDEYRALYRRKITDALQSGTLLSISDDLRSRPSSLPWRAIEEILFDQIARSDCKKEIGQLFLELGYKGYYENRLKSRRPLIRAAAVDKIGKMLSEFSTAGLVEILSREEHPEILAVTARALSRNGSREGLTGILERLPDLYRRSLVSRKTIEASLINFSADAVPLLVAYGSKSDDAKIRASLLEVLAHLAATPLSLEFAAANLNADDPEVRARAVKVFARHDASADMVHPELLLPLLEDPVWFVRLQSARALGKLKYEQAVESLGRRLLDTNWQVRNAAARALANIGDASLDVFLNILKYKDRYAKESICEEAGRTNFTQRLISNLMSRDETLYAKSREMLGIMHSLHLSTSLHEYLKSGEEDAIKREIALLMRDTAAPRESDRGGEGPRSPAAQSDGEGKKA